MIINGLIFQSALKSILTDNEAYFYQLLLEIGYKGLIVITKVRLADIFEVAMPKYSKGWRTQFNRIASKHIDYLIIDRAGTPLIGIELDDSTHQRADRQLSDQFKDVLFQSCVVPLVRFPLHFQYTPKEIHEKLKSHIPHNARRHLDPPPMPVPTPAKPIHLIAQERMAEKPKPHVFISSPTKPQPTKPLHIIAQERKASVL